MSTPISAALSPIAVWSWIVKGCTSDGGSASWRAWAEEADAAAVADASPMSFIFVRCGQARPCRSWSPPFLIPAAIQVNFLHSCVIWLSKTVAERLKLFDSALVRHGGRCGQAMLNLCHSYGKCKKCTCKTWADTPILSAYPVEYL